MTSGLRACRFAAARQASSRLLDQNLTPAQVEEALRPLGDDSPTALRLRHNETAIRRAGQRASKEKRAARRLFCVVAEHLFSQLPALKPAELTCRRRACVRQLAKLVRQRVCLGLVSGADLDLRGVALTEGDQVAT